ncbi:MAG: nickel pincer cofactor biosynthesis protein LarC [Bacteroidetes bacterium]|nr:MAG: nickel pincer cofactor biosynthesis protein LarC [Bacteroidota bacterium]RLD96215.1 MAG: nickel pincer cofactor biosynthesis protein LarC [Bacteroidota bacterium]
MKRILYYDCFAGISGDMNLGALVDLGVDAGHLERELGKLNIEGFRLEVKADMRKGISGTKVTVVVDHPENEKHRHLSHIEELINGSSLSDSIKAKSLAIFDLVAEAEAKVHNISKEKVHFHEVGALDSIADIVGAAICQEYLEVDEIQASPVQLGGGFVKCAHGMMPVPAPATAEIVAEIPVKTGLVDYEATTPTGAAILAATVDRFESRMELVVLKTGYGIGQRDGEIPNVLRVYLAEGSKRVPEDVEEEEAVMLECNLDDMNPERYTHVMDLLFEAGAADVFIIPIVMKKSRPGHMLSVLCSSDSVDKMKEILFTETSSIGLREHTLKKSMLRREMVVVSTKYGEIEVKRSYFNGKVVNEKPEFEQCRKLAREHGVTLEEISNEVTKKL